MAYHTYDIYLLSSDYRRFEMPKRNQHKYRLNSPPPLPLLLSESLDVHLVSTNQTNTLLVLQKLYRAEQAGSRQIRESYP